MRLARWLLAIILAVLVGGPSVAAQAVPKLHINSTRYVVVDEATGDIYAQKGANDRVAIASLTKVFTAVQAMEMAPLDTIITTKDFDLRTPDGGYFGSNGTLMGFDAGQSFTLEDMLYGMLLPSGNDAANAVARSLGMQPGDTDQQAVQYFMDLVNQRITDMGLKNTHLMNPHGWGVKGHYSSAADLAAFNRMVFTYYPTLIKVMGATSYTTSDGSITVTNTNKSLRLYQSVVAGKTGYDWDSGYCLINFAKRGDVGMVAVTLDGVAPNDWYDDNATLLDYGFQQQEAIAKSGKPFEGEVARYLDPDVVAVQRSASSSASFASADRPAKPRPPKRDSPAIPTTIPVQLEAPVLGQSTLRAPGRTTTLIAVGSAVAILALVGIAGLGAPSRRELVGPKLEVPAGDSPDPAPLN